MLLESHRDVTVFLGMVGSIFEHDSFGHLLGNMLALWIFGNNVEDAMGHARYFLFFILTGIFAVLTQGIFVDCSFAPTVWISGAVFGVMGAYLLLHPRAKIYFTIIFVTFHRVSIPAWIVIGFYILQNIAMVAIGSMQSMIWYAHLGGAAAGMILLILLRYSNVQLFGDARNPAFPDAPDFYGGPESDYPRIVWFLIGIVLPLILIGAFIWWLVTTL
ncbi:MAG: rhomboid family intramembrane serine protease, partial [Pseudomonadota bacterium]|nr:rhomboid family intramembrane serine protease [Pseudomonadota bacterium]